MNTATPTDFDAAVAALAASERLLVAAHESPDGDAFGSILGAALGLRWLGKDVRMYIPGSLPFPVEFSFLPLAEVLRELPDDLETRALLAVDCANERRLGPDRAALERARLVVNVDHHHDNSRFGAVNLVVADASSSSEIVGDLLAALGVPLSPAIAEALYVGLVTDTGRFQYPNTTPKAHRFAALLAEAGADISTVFQHVYETVQFPKLKLLGLALERASRYEDGRLLVSHLLRSDFAAVGAQEPYADGIIDILRQTEGSEVVALIREPLAADGPTHKVSLRSSTEAIDVSAIARERGGGGHRQAAGFSSEESCAEITAFLRGAFSEQGRVAAGHAAAGR